MASNLKAAAAIEAFVKEWTKDQKEIVKKGNTDASLKDLQDELEKYWVENEYAPIKSSHLRKKKNSHENVESDGAAKATIAPNLSNIKKSRSSFKLEPLGKVKTFLNMKHPEIGVIDEDWEFNLKGEEQGYNLYYPKEDRILNCAVTIIIKRGIWRSFRYEVLDPHITDEKRVYKTQLESHILTTNEATYVTAIEYDLSHGYVHEKRINYAFYTKGNNKNTKRENYLFGSFSNLRDDTRMPSAGLCLLKKADPSKDGEQQTIDPEIIAYLYRKRVEIKPDDPTHSHEHLPNHDRIQDLESFSGNWQGLQFYSRGGTRYFRKFGLIISKSGKAEIKNMDLSVKGGIKSSSGFVSIGQTKQLYCEFSRNRKVDDYKERMLICLMTNQNNANQLYGSYCGFSSHSLPYGGAIVFERLAPGKEPLMKNILPVEQALEDQFEEVIESLKIVSNNFLDLPDKSLSTQFLAQFRGYRIHSELNGTYLTFSLSAKKNAIVSYPMIFRDGICTSYFKSEKDEMKAAVREIGRQHIWLHLRIDGQDVNSATAISYDIDDRQSDEQSDEYYTGMSFRINGDKLLQAKKEILIRWPDDLTKENKCRKVYIKGHKKYGKAYDDALQTLPQLKEIFENLLNDRNILQNIN